jgi:catechol-2,3-dioxygenase
MPMPDPARPRGVGGFRHGFRVSRDRFGQLVRRLRDHGITFEGPVQHPERGPLGESVYFQDPGGNFIEVCWRRDEVRSGAALDVG